MKTLKLTPPQATEADIQAALIRRLQRAGWVVVRINSGCHKTARGFFRAYMIAGLSNEKGQPASSGFPDVLALRGGECRLFEIKQAGGAVSKPQQQFQDFARRAGVTVEVVTGWEHMNEVTRGLEGGPGQSDQSHQGAGQSGSQGGTLEAAPALTAVAP